MKNKIPEIKRDAPLVNKLIPIVLVGFDDVFTDTESKLYIRLMVRLIDKSYSEYSSAKELIENEIKSGNKLEYRFNIVNHLENCVNSMNRAIKVFNSMVNDKKDFNILDFVKNEKMISIIKKISVSKIRNRVEHIDEDIYKNKFKSNLFLDVDEDYTKICINNKCIKLEELAGIIEDYHNFVLHIFNNMPNKKNGNQYYYDKK